MTTKPFVLILLLAPVIAFGAVTDTVSFPWPDAPVTESKGINGTFCEFRNTLTSDHFHNGVDIGEPDGNPVYPSLSGTVHSIGTVASSGTSAFVRVRTNVGGMWKHISYVHIEPNPTLVVESPVTAGSTILGTILNGLGHVHFTERELVLSETGNGAEVNAIRNGGGLTPYVDTYTPVINAGSVQFRIAGTTQNLPANLLFGNVDIVIKVDERNGPGSVGTTQTNNGTYMLGYRILSADRETVIVNPPDNGLRYRFDRMPFNSNVGGAFEQSLSTVSQHHYFVTNGGGANAVNSTRTVPHTPLNVDPLPEGDYQLFIFTQDTRGNTDSVYIPISVTKKDLVPPSIPVLKHVRVDTNRHVQVAWYPNPDGDVNGYRLSYASIQSPNTWMPAAGESVLTNTTFSITFDAPQNFAEPATGDRFLFRLQAVDTVSPPNVSTPSDVYMVSNTGWGAGGSPMASALIVDGFDRYGGTGSWSQPTHMFSASFTGLPTTVDISTAANESVADGSVDLQQFDMAFWVLGDESTADHTFTSTEQAKVKQFLEQGGKLFVSGAEVGWDLGRSHAASEPGDLSFYNNYLKAAYVYDGASSMTTATGVAGQLFAGYTFNFGVVYPEDYPDDINPLNGSAAVLHYNATRDGVNPRIAGVSYAGTFGPGTVPGAVVYLAFPFESIASLLQRTTILTQVLGFFGYSTSDVTERHGTLPDAWFLSHNYPNPFNPATHLTIRIPTTEWVHIKVYDILGREVATLLDGERAPGTSTVTWQADGFPSGMYVVRMRAGAFTESRKLTLMK